MTTSYTPSAPGTWLLLVNGDTVLFVEAAASAMVDELWVAVSGATPMRAVLDILMRNGLSGVPSFALGHIAADTLHALVRGPIVLDAVAAGGTEAIDGTGVSTWRETTVDGVTALSLGQHAGHLPIGSGVVWAAGFAFQPGGAPIEAPVVAPLVEPVVRVAPVATPAPAPAPVIETPAPVLIDVPVAVVPTPTPVSPPAEVTDPDLPSEHTMVEREEEPESEPEPVIEPVEIPAAPPADVSYSHLFEETVHRTIEEAAIREEEPEEAAAPAAAAPAAASSGDHDGETVMSGDISALRDRKKVAAAPSVAPIAPAIYLELPNNQREALSQPVIIGRSPSVSQVSGAELPRLVSIPGSQDISRNHARFAVEGGTVVVTDLHSRNGTSVALPGKPPQMLRKGEPTAVLPGTVVDLGGGISLTVREG